VIRQPETSFYGQLHHSRLIVLVALAAVLTAAVIVIVLINYLRQRTVRKMAADAVVDPLTGLATRRLLGIRLDYAVPRNRRAGTHLAVLFGDLDGFKEVNDRYGHAAGDQLLQALAARLRRCVRDEDLVARVGGDEFVVLVEELHDLSELQDLGHRLLAAVVEPVDLAAGEVRVRVSIGVAVLPPGSSMGDQVLEAADRAMYDAKQSGGGMRTVVLDGAPVPARPSTADHV
jgi:diguanylate cyclase (GGDEF)-like protein